MAKQQKTYLVLPQFNEGLMSPEDLEKLVSLVREYGIKKVKITGAQRLAFIGMAPETMATIKAELGIPAELPHIRHRVHYVQACPGSTWCRYGQADTLSLAARIRAIELDEQLPYKVKAGISGCRFCCCESWLRDVGLTAERKGWRLSFGGNAAGRPRIGDLVADGLSDDEAVALVTRTLACYSAKAEYKTRSARFMERFGIDALQRTVLG